MTTSITDQIRPRDGAPIVVVLSDGRMIPVDRIELLEGDAVKLIQPGGLGPILISSSKIRDIQYQALRAQKGNPR